MAIPLQPKIRDRNPAQTLRRLQAYHNGWSLIPSEAKALVPKGWPKLKNDAPAIEGWNNPKLMRAYAGTGVRVEGLLCVLDIDVSHAAASQGILRRLAEAYPEVMAHALCRTSGTRKVALFFLVDKPIGMRRTARYGDGECVEVFGSLVVRYFAIEGPHPVEGRFYAWVGGAPWDTRLDSLPVFRADDIGALIDMCDDELGKHLPRVLNSVQTENAGETVYDLEPGQTFITTDGEEIELTELEDSLQPNLERTGIRTLPDWHASERKNHWKAILDRRGHLILMDFSENNTQHRWKTDKPDPTMELDDNAKAVIAELAASTEQPESDEPEPEPEPRLIQAPPMPSADAAFNLQVGWLLATHAHSKLGQVVEIFEPSAACTLSMKTFDDHYAAFSVPRLHPLVGRDFATRLWRSDPRRTLITSHDMRPDKAFPLFTDDGKVFKNTYLREQHQGNGEVETVLAFFQHLLPTDAAYFQDWLGHKWQNPWIPGHALIMVAAAATDGDEQSGTGRGTLFKILERLFGRRYVRHLDFNILTGQSAQGVYTDWMADSLLVCVDESREGTGRFGERRSAYEHLKARCDPAPRWMTVHPKGQPARDSLIVCSYIIATNHADALMLPASDRRFAVLSNGEKLGLDAAERIYAWMDDPGNIAALARWLAARDVSAFKATGWPPITAARDRMMEMSESELDRLVREALWAMPGLVFTRRQLLTHLHNLAGDSDLLHSGAIQAQLTQVMRVRLRGLSMPGVRPRKERRSFVQGEGQVRGYVRSAGDEAKCALMSNEEIRAEIARNGLRAAGEEAEKADGPH